MKVNGKLLAFCVFQLYVWGTTAFIQNIIKAFEAPFGTADKKRMSTPTQTRRGRRKKPGKNFQISTQKARERKQRSAATRARGSGPKNDVIYEDLLPERIEGGSLKTLSFASPSVETVQVVLETAGRPLDADVELWQGPDNAPLRMRVYTEDGRLRPFRVEIATPRAPNTIAIRNIGHTEFPLDAYVEANVVDKDSISPFNFDRSTDIIPPRILQGGSLRSYPFDPSVESVQVMLKTDGSPLNARIELLQGPNNDKQVIDIYTEDGMDRPIFTVIESPGSGNVVRIINTGPMEFPLTISVEPYLVSTGYRDSEAMVDGHRGGYIDFVSNRYGEMAR